LVEVLLRVVRFTYKCEADNVLLVKDINNVEFQSFEENPRHHPLVRHLGVRHSNQYFRPVLVPSVGVTTSEFEVVEPPFLQAENEGSSLQPMLIEQV
jgi:hypothetical protein